MAAEKKHELTQEQNLALAIDRHIAVTANAGSGKTSVLEQRYVVLLDSPEVKHDPSRIIAITFTRKASAEILSRIAGNIEKKMNSQEATFAEMQILNRIREKLPNAPISTIHSFCSNLLKNYPIESGVAPNFMEISTAESITIKKNAISDILEDWLVSEDSSKVQRTKELFSALGRKDLEEYIGIILGKRELFSDIAKIYSCMNPEKYQELCISKIVSLLYPKLIQLCSNLNELLVCIDTSNIKKQNKSSLELFSSALGNFELATEKLSAKLIYENLQRSIQHIKGVNKALRGSSKNSFLAFAKSGLPENFSSEISEQIHEDLNFFLKFNETLGNINETKIMFELARTLIEICEDVIAEIDEKKEEESLIDFDDMLIKTNSLLDNPDVLASIRKKTEFLMIDEFQDTNKLQYEIVKKLVPGLAEPHADSSIKLFIVGDDKQSIYGFRNADVRVFNQAKADIMRLNQQMLEAHKISEGIPTPKGEINPKKTSEVLGNMTLTTTFRLEPVLCAFVNRVCGKLMQAEKMSADNSTQYEVEYSSIVCGKNVAAFFEDNEKERFEFADNSFGKITFLTAIKPPRKTGDAEEIEEDTNETSTSEAKNLVKYIKNMVANNECTYSDITVLSRSLSPFSELVAAMQEKNIPYIVHSGSGFFNAQEIMDIISYLKFLYKPFDDLALAATLRSIFFNLEDTDLYIISRQKGNLPLWEKMCNVAIELGKIESSIQLKNKEFVLKAHRILSEMLTLAPSMNIPLLIERMLDKSAIYGIITSTIGSQQIKANISKFLDYARQFSHKGFKNLYDFVEEVCLMSALGAKEKEAVSITGENAVNLMTIHSAKGLQAPVVVLYNANKKGHNPANFNVSEELGLLFPFLKYDPMSLAKDTIRTPALMYAQECSRLAEYAEEKRILYVALTRAERQLVVSSTIQQIKESYSSALGFLKMILEGMNLETKDLSSNSVVNYSDRLLMFNDNAHKAIELSYPIEFIVEHEDQSGIITEERSENKLPKFMLEDISTANNNELYSASKLMQFEENPDEYMRRYLLGLHSSDDDNFHSQAPTTEPDKDMLIGSLAGTLIHSALEQIKLWINPTHGFDEEKLFEVIENILLYVPKPQKNKAKDRILQECRNIASTPLVQKMAKFITNSRLEYELQMPLANDFLIAKIDMLLQNPSNEWEIWDWKTNRIDTPADMTRLVNHYRKQMKIYAFFVSKLHPEQEKITARLLFTRLASPRLDDKKWTHTFQWSRAELFSFEQEIQDEIKAIMKI